MKNRNSMQAKQLALNFVFLMAFFFANPLTVLAQPHSGWDRSSLSFVGNCSLMCQENFEATVCNVGDRDMAGPTSWELYYAPSGNPKNGTIIAQGELLAMSATEPDNCTTLSYPVSENGNYMFHVYQRTGHPGQGVLWSEGCGQNCELTAPIPEPTTSPEPTTAPEQSQQPELNPEPTSEPVATESATQVITTPLAATPSANPEAASNSNSSNNNSTHSDQNAIGGSETNILGVTALANTGNSSLISIVTFALGLVLTAKGMVCLESK